MTVITCEMALTPHRTDGSHRSDRDSAPRISAQPALNACAACNGDAARSNVIGALRAPLHAFGESIYSAFVDELAERFARAERQGLIEIVRAHVDIPLAELLVLIDDGRTGRMLGTLTIAECRDGRANEDAVEYLNKARLRAAYDARILDVLRDAGEPLSPTEVQERVGGSAQEARTALQRLAAAKKVTRTWKERGHGYLLGGS